ncbi:MAG: family 20 glycosylhydrolase [Clostridium sp.]|nr:family 20 glycosylhydrolase [Bacteroides sp.]MCM1198817.1 family 20 glycosylhydrolase [Clostridium sp.]
MMGIHRTLKAAAFSGLAAAMLLADAGLYASEISVAGPDGIIPVPENTVYGKGEYLLPEAATFSISCITGEEDAGLEDFIDYVEASPLGLTVFAGRPSRADVRIHAGGKTGYGEEGYILEISKKGIDIKADGLSGAFYAVQSLLQMTRDGQCRGLQCCTVSDSPRFGYRGLMVDVSRHFRSVDFLKRQMDAMALFKLNRMHLHLTDAAGWRLETDAFPRLTEFAAWRPQRKWMDWTAAGARYCEKDAPSAYGGYYTKDDIRELLEYAAVRHIMIIPEIEMPGHSEEVTAAYPALGCSGKPYVNGDVCPGKEETFSFFENVLAEVMEMFPSEYIHIGGDEAGKGAWSECPHCRRRMEEEGLSSVDELQSYLIHRIEKFVNSKGRKIIGWDEIMDGGLAPNATVMSWRGSEQGIAAAKAGHDVIMTPGAYCYIDYNQDAPFREPLSIGGYTPLSKVYSYEPSEPGVTDEDMSHILGVQANLWAEYITDDSHAEYMYYPRALAIAEIGWSRPERKEYASFRDRAVAALGQLRMRGYETFDLENEYGERKASLTEENHLAVGAKVTYSNAWHPKYPASGETTLTDGIIGGWTYGDMRWQGFLTDIDVTVDLGEATPVKYIGATFMQSPGAWVYLPEQVRISVSSDGASFENVAVVNNEFPYRDQELVFIPFAFTGETTARYIRLEADVHTKPGSWLFLDEIVVR